LLYAKQRNEKLGLEVESLKKEREKGEIEERLR
jgi:hypothetical protein